MYRSWLFVPGRSAQKLQKAKTLAADSLIFDLEDAVSQNEKGAAREITASELNEVHGKYQYVRVNSVESEYVFDDVSATIDREGLSGYILPKAETKDDIIKFDYLVRKLAARRSSSKEIAIVPLIETARGIMNAHEIATACKSVQRLGFGAIDLMLDLFAGSTTADTVLFGRQMLVLASTAAGLLPPIDSVDMEFRELDGLRHEAKRAKCMGYGGKFVIHPNQIKVVNEIFSEDAEQVKKAEQIVAAYEEAVSKGHGVVQVDGKMVDLPVYENAKRVLKQNES